MISKRAQRHGTIVLAAVLISVCDAAPIAASPLKEPAATLTPRLREAIRSGATAQIQKLLDAGASANALDAEKNTPLLLAAFYAGVDSVRLLLKRGADANAANTSGTTSLMLAAGHEAKVRALLAGGASVKAKSKLGNTALHLATRFSPSAPVVRLLLDRDADVNARNRFGVTPLIIAASTDDNETLRLLLDAGADVEALPKAGPADFLFGGGQSALMWTSGIGNEAGVELLLKRGARVNQRGIIGTPLTMAAQKDRLGTARQLLEAGAKVDQPAPFSRFTPLMWAAGTENGDAALVELLLARGANPNATGGQAVDAFMTVAQTAHMTAMRRGPGAVTQALKKAGAKPRHDPWSRRSPRPPKRDLPAGPLPASLLVEAIHRATPPLETSAMESYREYIAKKQNCVSCHNQYLPVVALAAAGKKGLARDEQIFETIVHAIKKDEVKSATYAKEPTFHPGPAETVGYAHMALAAAGRPADRYTDASVHMLTSTQAGDGRWYNYFPRPPLTASDAASTALAIRSLTLYPVPGRKREIDDRVARARRWLGALQPRNTDERTAQLLGLFWSGEMRDKLEPLGEALLKEQRQDGGWAQLATLTSDPYATGLVLYALHHALGTPETSTAYQRGLRFLLREQLADGTWFVRRRAFPFQPTMESGFPHGRDAWISVAGTSWAVLALSAAVDPKAVQASKRLERPKPSHKAEALERSLPPAAARQVDFAKDVQPIFVRSCRGCHSGRRARSRYSMETRAQLIAGGANGEPAVVVGKSAASPLIQYVAGLEEDLEMPPRSKRKKYPALTEKEISLLRAWVDQGAVWEEKD